MDELPTEGWGPGDFEAARDTYDLILADAADAVNLRQENATLRKKLADLTVAAKEMLEDLKDAWAQEGKTEGWMENACVGWQAVIRAAEGAGE